MKTYAIYAVISVAVLLYAYLGVNLYLAQGEISSLKLSIETAKVEAERHYTSQLRAQQTAHNEVIKTERAVQLANRRHYQRLLGQAQQEVDHADRAARSLIVLVNGLLDRLAARFGTVDAADPGSAVADRPTSTEAGQSGGDQYTDLATALDDTVTWCEMHVGRLEAIGAVQRAALID